jgi:hypothetical protein
VPEILPKIGYVSVLDAATLTATPATYAGTGTPDSVKDWRAWTFWRPTTGTTRTLDADLGSSKTVSAVAIYGHDAVGAVTVSRWTGSAWAQVATTTAVAGGAVLWISFDAVATTKLRIEFAALSYLAIVWAGEPLTLPIGVSSGWSDPTLAQRPQLFPEMSRRGVHLGTAVEMWEAKLTLAISNLEAEWVRDYWMPLIRTCAARPFFMNWNDTEWSSSACLCSNADFGNAEFSQRGLINVSVSFTADTGYDQRATP